MGSNESGYRAGKRVEYHFLVRIKPVRSSAAAAWDVSTIRNISKTGILFYSSNRYERGTDVEVRITNPIIAEEIICLGQVARCEPQKDMKDIYGVAVEITGMDPESREVYDQTVKLFIEKAERPK